MLSLPELERMKRSMAPIQEEVDRHIRGALLAGIAVGEFTCPRCRQAPGLLCKMMFFRRWRTRFDAFPPAVHKERIVAAITVYGD
jgi:hypothetical protein